MPTALIVGAGPAGAALAYLLAHRGIEVTLLERQLDFSREFRGEVLMPSGVLAIEEMGLSDAMNSVSSVDQKSISLYLNASLVFRQELGSDALGFWWCSLLLVVQRFRVSSSVSRRRCLSRRARPNYRRRTMR